MKSAFFIITLLYALSCKTINLDEEKQKGIRLYRSDSLEQSIKILSAVIKKSDTCGDCYLYRGLSYKALEENKKALVDFDKYIALENNEGQAVGFANKASVYYAMNDYKNSLSNFQKAYSLTSNKEEFFNPISHMLFATGEKDSACIFYYKSLAIGDTTFDESLIKYCEKSENYH